MSLLIWSQLADWWLQVYVPFHILVLIIDIDRHTDIHDGMTNIINRGVEVDVMMLCMMYSLLSYTQTK